MAHYFGCAYSLDNRLSIKFKLCPSLTAQQIIESLMRGATFTRLQLIVMASTIVLITGANSGIGYACSKVLVCCSNAFHVIMACRSLEKAKSAVSEIEALGIKGTLSAIQLEVTDELSIQNAVSIVESQFGRLDVLVNNAGVGGLTSNIKESYKLCLETNVMGPAMVADAFRPLLLKSKNPYSIFISSGARTLLRNAHEKPPSHAHIQNGNAYQVSKAALNMLAVLEARDHGPALKVFAMSPGFVRSNLRGTDEDARSGWGQAGDPEEAGELLLSIVQGKRDKDVGCLIYKDGVFAW